MFNVEISTSAAGMSQLAVVKKYFGVSVCVVFLSIQAMSQPVDQIRPAMRLETVNIKGGMGVSVVWNPGVKTYYAAISGTGDKWLLVYNQEGKPMKNPYSLPFDPGSLWLDGTGKSLKSYASGMEGLYEIHLREGIPAYFENVFYALHNPVAIGNGAWVSRRKELWYYHDKTIYRYKTRHAHHRSPLNLNIEDFENELNAMGVVYTGIKNREIGLYDRAQHRILLYNIKNGRCNRVLQILDEAGPRPLCGDFAFSNGYYWLYNRETGVWHGYR
jgi:hypothetical protein